MERPGVRRGPGPGAAAVRQAGPDAATSCSTPKPAAPPRHRRRASSRAPTGSAGQLVDDGLWQSRAEGRARARPPRSEPRPGAAGPADGVAVRGAAGARAASGVAGRPPVPVRLTRTSSRPRRGCRTARRSRRLYYVTCPRLTGRISTLEGAGLMAEMTAELAADPELAQAYSAAHEDYLARRAALGDVPEIAGVSAGGMPTRVKCLHVLVGHALAAGAGVNPLGDEALAAARRRVGHGGSRRAVEPPGGGLMTRVAAIDCGTNSIRLLVADDRPGGRHVARPGPADGDRPARPGRRPDRPAGRRRAGAGPSPRPRSTPPPARARVSSGSGSWPPRRPGTRPTATEFVDGIRSRLGVEPEVVSGAEEAALSFAGATARAGRGGCRGAVPRGRHRWWLDRGGARCLAGVEAARSVDIGCVRLTERHLHGDPPTPAEIAAAASTSTRRARPGRAPRCPLAASRHPGRAGRHGHDRCRALPGAGPLRPARASTASRLPVADVVTACDDLLGMNRERAKSVALHASRAGSTSSAPVPDLARGHPPSRLARPPGRRPGQRARHPRRHRLAWSDVA